MLFRFRSLCRVERSVFPAKPLYWKTALRTSGYTRAFTAALETWRDTRLQMHMWSHVNEVRLSQSFQSLHSRSASWSWSCLHSKHGLILKLNNPVASTKIANPTKGDAGCKPWRFIWHPTSTKKLHSTCQLEPWHSIWHITWLPAKLQHESFHDSLANCKPNQGGWAIHQPSCSNKYIGGPSDLHDSLAGCKQREMNYPQRCDKNVHESFHDGLEDWKSKEGWAIHHGTKVGAETAASSMIAWQHIYILCTSTYLRNKFTLSIDVHVCVDVCMGLRGNRQKMILF